MRLRASLKVITLGLGALALCGATTTTTTKRTTTLDDGRQVTTTRSVETNDDSYTNTSATGAGSLGTVAIEPPGTAIQVTSPPSPDDVVINTVNYACEDGRNLTVSFNDTVGTATVSDGEDHVILPEHALSSATFDYSDGPYDLRGKHEMAVWRVGDSSVRCDA